MTTAIVAAGDPHEHEGHRAWVRVTHWLIAASVLTLMASGLVILAAHPRLYWGEVGNDMTKPLIELPLGRNYHHGGWVDIAAVADNGAVSAVRTYDIFNHNGWARSLHFLMAWCLVGSLLAYLGTGLASGHVRRTLIPRRGEAAPKALLRDIGNHLRLKVSQHAGPPYGPLQKLAYGGVAFILLPLMVATGLAMSPAVAAATRLPELFGGSQSARTLHFACFAALALFLAAHLVMIALSGARRQLTAMIRGRP